MAFCKNCGKELKDDAKFCGGCGAARGTVTNQPVVTSSINFDDIGLYDMPQKKNKIIWPIVRIIGVLLLVLGVVVVGLFGYEFLKEFDIEGVDIYQEVFGTSQSKLESQVKQMCQEMIDEDDDYKEYRMKVVSVSLIKTSKNKYEGMAEVTVRGGSKKHNISLDVKFDGSQILLSTKPGAFLFLLGL